ncbi:HAMP domain-containing sensor histidine kinase [Nocardioides sp. GY 10113]|uniref:sensor histidine kinase n=1 Tax=Nocardioides sp. GY 10113 TaxID=2569761 RepID=UPI0014581103|nr:HAMP domain-containing sensor histidine kinase [Nocardioides sp. GY 10113]
MNQATTVAQVVVASLCAASAVVVYFQYRVSRLQVLAWTSLGMAIYGTESIGVAMIQLSGSGEILQPVWTLMLNLDIAIAVAVAAYLSRSRTCRVDPLATGTLIGLTVAFLHSLIDTTSPAPPEWLPAVGIGALTIALWTFSAATLVRSTSPVHPWVTHRIGVGFVALATGRVAGLVDVPGATATALVLTNLGGILVVCGSLAGLRLEIQRHEEWLESLGSQLARLEEDQMDQRSRLHEITNTVAGIACASNLIRSSDDLSEQYRSRLEEMLDRESARLARILAGTADEGAAPGAPDGTLDGSDSADQGGRTATAVDLDTLIRPLVSAQQALGREIRWKPSGVSATGDADAITEALNILLDNSRKHAPGATTTVLAREVAGSTEVVVSDDGPGIAPEIGERSFTWGERGPSSKGQGIGLNVARTRVERCGGSLEVAPAEVGATFVVRLLGGSDTGPDRVRGTNGRASRGTRGELDQLTDLPELALHQAGTFEEAS